MCASAHGADAFAGNSSRQHFYARALRGLFLALLPLERGALRPLARAPVANALGGECPPAPACGRRLLLYFAPKAIRTRVKLASQPTAQQPGAWLSCHSALPNPNRPA